MTGRSAGRVLLLATALCATACGTQPPTDGSPSASSTASSTTSPTTSSSSSPMTAPDDATAGYASAFLGAGGPSGSDDVFVHASVWAPPGEAAFANGEFFVLGYDCLTEESVPAEVDGLETAWARGTLALNCGSHTAPGEVTGTAVVDLTWTAEGPVRRRTVESPDGSCSEALSDRHAVVRGEVRLVLPALGYDGVAVPLLDDDDSISEGVPACG